MKKLLIIGAMMASMVAHADMIKNANINAVCGDEIVGAFLVKSNAYGSMVQFEDILTIEGSQLIAGTEGGGPYAQVVQSGYNITFLGGTFEEAFYSDFGVELEGSMTAYVSQYDSLGNSINSFETECYGTYSFESAFE